MTYMPRTKEARAHATCTKFNTGNEKGNVEREKIEINPYGFGVQKKFE